MGKKWKQWETIFLGSKITVDGDCSWEIKRGLLLRTKAVTNLDSILKSRDITESTKAHTVKATILPGVMYRCESWTIKRAECWRTDFELWCWRILLRVPWTAWRLNQSILKEINPEYSLEGLMLKLKLQYSGHLMWRTDSVEKTDAGKDWRQEERGWHDEMVGWYHQLSGHEFVQTLGVGEGQGSWVCCSSWGHKELDRTEWLNNKWHLKMHTSVKTVLQKHILLTNASAITLRVSEGPALPDNLVSYHLLCDIAWCDPLWQQHQICSLIKKESEKQTPLQHIEQEKKSPHREWPRRPQLNDEFHL